MSTRQHYFVFFLVVPLLLDSGSPFTEAADSPPSAGDKEPAGLGDYVAFPAAGVRLRQPEGFEKADTFDGFMQPDTLASILIVSISGAFSEITAGFTEESMKAQGWKVLCRQEAKVDGEPSLLVNFQQSARGDVFLKWSLIIGDERKTIMITATMPKRLERELSARLKAAVLSARRDRAALDDPAAQLPFTITASPKLKRAHLMSRMLSYTKDGVTPAKSPQDPVLLIAPSLGSGVIEDEREFAERRIRRTARTKQLELKSTVAVTLDGLSGYESLAEAVDVKSETPLVVYQVILFDEGAYILMVGLVGAELRDEYLPAFKATARSFKRKPASSK